MPAARYESPEVKTALTTEEVRQRYRDTALVIFKVRGCARPLYML